MPVVAWLPGPSRATHFRSHYFVSDAPRSLIEFQKPARDTDDGVENVMQTNHEQIKKQRLRNQSANRRRPQVSAVNLQRPCCCSDPLYLLQLPYMKHIRPARALNLFENYVARTSLLLNSCHKPAGCLPCACCRSCCFCLTISKWCQTTIFVDLRRHACICVNLVAAACLAVSSLLQAAPRALPNRSRVCSDDALKPDLQPKQ